MAFVFRNPHPELKRVGDCMKRAFVLSTGINYHDMQVMLNRYNKLKGHSRDAWKDFIVDVLGGIKHHGDMQHEYCGRRYTVAEFASDPTWRGKTAICRVAKHLVCTKGGNYYDTWDSGAKGVYIVWWIKDYEEVVERIRRIHPKLCQGLTLERHRTEL